MFQKGGFSSDSTRPFQADSMGLFNLSQREFQEYFQVSLHNPLFGVASRMRSMHALGEILQHGRGVYFRGVDRRPSNIIDYLLRQFPSGQIPASFLLQVVLKAFGYVWPKRLYSEILPLGDGWIYSALGERGFRSIVPFHKLCQWLTYSLIEPLEEYGIEVSNLNAIDSFSR